VKITEKDRQAAKQRSTKSMSQTAADKLRAINEQARLTRLSDVKFIAQFEMLPKDTLRLAELLLRISSDYSHLCMRANKLRLCLAKGWKPTSAHDVLFIAALTPEEAAMDEVEFTDQLASAWPNVAEAKRGLCKVCKAELTGRRTAICEKAGCRASVARNRRPDPLQMPPSKPAIYAGRVDQECV
jgi:hypothetical protein